MILSSELYKEHGVRKGIVILIKYIVAKYFSAFFHFLKREDSSSFHKATYQAKGIRNYPLLLTDKDAQSSHQSSHQSSPQLKCISCGLCEKVCPTNCISIQSSKESKVPKTLMSGPTPISFNIKLQQCTRCGYCVDVCPVDAIELSGVYDFYSDPAKTIWGKTELTAKDIKS
jgi:NADH-quinone oxidoreductase subunit I